MRVRRARQRFVFITSLVGLTVAVAAWAQQAKQTGEVIEGRIKQAAFKYYFGLVMGDPDQYFQGTRMPLQTVKNGKMTFLDEAGARAMLKALAAKQQEKPLTKDERTQVVGNIIRALDESDIRFIGANTASLAFLIRQDPNTKADYLCSLTLYRADAKAGEWRVIQEVTDSEPVPAEYLKEPGKPLGLH